MKYVLGLAGFVLGNILVALISASQPAQWITGVIFGFFAYHMIPFARYKRSSPKKLLSFHGPDAPISRTNSKGELAAFLSQLQKGGLLLQTAPSSPRAMVNSGHWDALSVDERTTFAQVVRQAYAVYTGAVDALTVEDENGNDLFRYP